MRHVQGSTAGPLWPSGLGSLLGPALLLDPSSGAFSRTPFGLGLFLSIARVQSSPFTPAPGLWWHEKPRNCGGRGHRGRCSVTFWRSKGQILSCESALFSTPRAFLKQPGILSGEGLCKHISFHFVSPSPHQFHTRCSTPTQDQGKERHWYL